MNRPSRCAAWTVLLLLGLAPSGFGQDATPQDNSAEPGDKRPAEVDYKVESNLEYARRDGKPLLLDAYLPEGDGPRPGVLVVHGGAWRSGSKAQLAFFAIALARRGIAAFAINYRLAPEHKFPAQIEDCRDAVRWILHSAKKYHLDTSRLGAIGYSAGGHLVALLGVQGVRLEDAAAGNGEAGGNGAEGNGEKQQKVFRFRAVAPGGAPCDFRTLPPRAPTLKFWLGGTRRELPDVYRDASPAAFVSDRASPMFFFHGEEDALVNVDGTKKMVQLLKQAGADAQIRVAPGAGHITVLFKPEVLKAAFDFLEERLEGEEEK